MKRERNLTCLVGFLLAALVSIGGVGCMVSGLRLEVSGMLGLILACILASAIACLCYRFPRGGWVLLGLFLLGGMWLAGEPERLAVFWGQLRAMLNRMTTLWHNAYGWPVVMPGEEIFADQPLMVIGALVAVAVSRTVCCQKRAVLPLITGLLPLGSCLVVTDTAPDTGYIFMLVLGLIILLLTNSIRRSDLGQGLELTATAAVMSAVALTLLFGFVPRDSYVNQSGDFQEAILTWAQDLPTFIKEWGQQSASGDVTPVQIQRENLSTLGDRIERNISVLEVTAAVDGLLYLRGQDFDGYDGKNWTAARNRREEFLPADSLAADTASAGGQVTIDARRVRNVRYVPYYPQSDVTFVGGRVSNDDDLQVYSYTLKILPENWRETVNAAQSYDNGIYTTAGIYDSANDNWRYRNLPLETQTRAEALLRAILTGEERSATDKADAIAAYVRNSAVYSLAPGTMPSEETDFALWFLEYQTEGYCVHFATATAVLLRAAGIDARYVTGYVVEASAGQTVTVYDRQSHAWVEYFEPRLGCWVVLESTPADLIGSEEMTGTAPSEETTVSTETEETTAIGGAEETQEPEQDPTNPLVPPEDRPGNTPGGSVLTKLLKWLLSIALAAAAVTGQRQLRLRHRRKRQKSGPSNARALAAWREAELLYRLLKEEIPQELEILAQKAKFSQHKLDTEELLVFDTAIRGAKRRLQAQPWHLRLIHQYIFAAY